MSQDEITDWIYPPHLKQLKNYTKYMKKITFDSIKQQATQDSDYCEGEINMMSYLPDYSAGRENPGRVQQFPELKR